MQIIIDDDHANFYLKIQAMLYQCDILLLELRVLENNEVLKEITHLLDRITHLAEGKSLVMMIEVQILQANMAIINGKGEQAFQFLEEALSSAQKMDLKHYIQKLIDEKKKVEKQIKTWNHLNEKNSPLGEIMKQLEIHEYLSQAIEITTLHSKD
ncbi:MAG: hypothetical protein ACXAC6_04480 [Candidatus Hodarchaeales archaeon]